MPSELLAVHIGGTGLRVGQRYWESVSQDHAENINSSFGPSSVTAKETSSVLFQETKSGQIRPRAVFCDLHDPQSHVRISGSIAGLSVADENVILSCESSGNCYAQAFHTDGPPVAQKVIDQVRRELEKCESVQGMQFVNSACGGTGSGLSGLILKGLSDYMGSKCVFHSATLVPSPSFTNIVLETYNTILALQDMTELTHMTSLFDLDACSHDTIPNILSAFSWSSRFPGPLHSDLRKMHMNLVPFKNCHFLVSSLITDNHLGAMDLAWKGLNPINNCLSVSRGSRYLSTMLAYRSSLIGPSEVDDVTVSLQKNGSDMDPYYPDWIPNSVSASISAGPSRSLLTVFNSTSMHEFLDRTIENFKKQFKAKSYLYVFAENGLHTEELWEAMNLVQYVSDQYKEYARYPDKLVTTDRSGTRRMIDESGPMPLDSEQRLIANELLL